MKNIILGIILGILSATYASSSYEYRLDLVSAACARTATTSPEKPNSMLWAKFESFLIDRDFSERSVLATLEDKFPEVSQVVPWMNCSQLLKTACNLKRLHFLSPSLKAAYENIFYALEFAIEELNPKDTSCLWSFIAGCGYRLPSGFIERLDFYTVKQSRNFSPSLIITTLRHLSALPEKRAFSHFASMLLKINMLPSLDDFHYFIFFKDLSY